eukprot:3557555-Amphidinium_carterae.1
MLHATCEDLQGEYARRSASSVHCLAKQNNLHSETAGNCGAKKTVADLVTQEAPRCNKRRKA